MLGSGVNGPSRNPDGTNAGGANSGASFCPACRKDAPIVYRGIMGYCTGCGAVRGPLVAPSVNMAGQPSKVGGTVAKFFGWAVLGVGLLMAVVLGGFFHLIFPDGYVGLAIGGPIAALAAIMGGSLLFGGKKLTTSGDEKQRQTREKGIWALAENQGGIIMAIDVSRALDIPLAEADAQLTELAKSSADMVAVDLDEYGRIYYRFTKFAPLPKVRVETGLGVGQAAKDAATQAAFDDAYAAEPPEEVEARRAQQKMR